MLAKVQWRQCIGSESGALPQELAACTSSANVTPAMGTLPSLAASQALSRAGHVPAPAATGAAGRIPELLCSLLAPHSAHEVCPVLVFSPFFALCSCSLQHSEFHNTGDIVAIELLFLSI